MRNIAALVVEPFQFLIIFPFAAIWNKWCCFHQNLWNCVINFFRKLFDNDDGHPQKGTPGLKQRPQAKPIAPVQRNVPQPEAPELYKKGDVIAGKYQIQRKLGEGGFGVVYLALNLEGKELCALKTFRQELITNVESRQAFKKEALLWIGLEQHPHIVGARWIEEHAGRLFVQMEYVPPDEMGRVSLADHLASQSLSSVSQVIEWSIQFCLGMEHSSKRNVKCHRDIKPGNILIGQGRSLKISDFGLAVAAEAARRKVQNHTVALASQLSKNKLNLTVATVDGREVCGTPGYMAPEVFSQGIADVRSDIYSFGVVLWQMAKGSKLPPFRVAFRGDMAVYMREIHALQLQGMVQARNTALGHVIERCLQVNPTDRYGNFAALRADLEASYHTQTGKEFVLPTTGELDGKAWNAKGASLQALGRHLEAIECFRKAIAWADAQNATSDAPWNNMGIAFAALEKHTDALKCYEKAIEINPHSASAWQNKAEVLHDLGRNNEAVVCYDRTLELDPKYPSAWSNKGIALHTLGRNEEALSCFDEALKLDSKAINAWIGKAWALEGLGMWEKALECNDKALSLDPLNDSAWDGKAREFLEIGSLDKAIVCFKKCVELNPDENTTWENMAVVLKQLGRTGEAIKCCDRAITIAPRSANAWKNKANYLTSLSHYNEALICFEKAVQFAPQDLDAWNNMAAVFINLGRLLEALACCDRIIKINAELSHVWRNRGIILRDLGQRGEEIRCYERALQLDPKQARVWYLKATAEEVYDNYVEARSSLLKFLEFARGDTSESSNIADAERRLQTIEKR